MGQPINNIIAKKKKQPFPIPSPRTLFIHRLILKYV